MTVDDSSSMDGATKEATNSKTWTLYSHLQPSGMRDLQSQGFKVGAQD